MQRLWSAVIAALTFATSPALSALNGRCALTEEQMVAAIRRGAESESADKFLERDLEGVRIKVSSIWGKGRHE